MDLVVCSTEAARIIATPLWGLDLIVLVVATIVLWWYLKGRK